MLKKAVSGEMVFSYSLIFDKSFSIMFPLAGFPLKLNDARNKVLLTLIF